ncbi:MAG: glycoside hydrolase family 2 TIM barrel-domain containing protein [Verrucomicrobiota bacterium]
MKFLTWLFLLSATCSQAAPTTERLYLSGKGPSDAVEWDFQVSAGRRAGEKAKIPVPSQWEQHGFGDYDYGSVPTKEKHKEDGLYHHTFTVPAAWKGSLIRIVFEGAMTDTTVKINGQQAGPMHQGGFYRFEFDITDKVRLGETNELEVLVSKDSANASVEAAERQADFWVFGGIFRPVWIEALPQQFIDWSSTDAQADGSLRAKVYLGGNGDADKLVTRVTTLEGKALGEPFTTRLTGSDPFEFSTQIPGVKPWSAESPQLYQLEYSLMKGDELIHRSTERIGFRTLEVRPGKGVFVNGSRITVKGVNRHSFRPETGRTLTEEQCYEDIRLIKSMNMNSVRSSHYPPDKVFLDACDELGLYVIDELCTWQKPMLDTPTATRLIHQIIRRDANHPSILWWANGNEGGWNTAVDGEFPRWDIQQRPVLHPWDPFSGFQTKHYPTWDQLNKLLAEDLLVMPTEFLHGLFDGGHGAGLEDFWKSITSKSNGVGGFLWVLADEGIARSDRNGAIDTWGINAPDGIVGPHHEKEASFFTIQDLFNPVQISLAKLPADFAGRIPVSNRYDFRDLASVRFEWKLIGRNATETVGGKLPELAAAPGKSAELAIPLPADWKKHSALQLTATDSDGQQLWTWSWAIHPAGNSADAADSAAPLTVSANQGKILATLSSGSTFEFDATSGRLIQAATNGKAIPLSNGPRFVGASPSIALPFSPVPLINASASSSGKSNGTAPGNAIDGKQESVWSQQGRDTWIQVELAKPAAIDHLAIAWQKSAERKASYALELSNDGKQWTEILRAESRPDQSGFEVSEFKQQPARFARVRLFGNNLNDWNSIHELKLGTRVEPKPNGVTHRMDQGNLVIETNGQDNLENFRWTLHPEGSLDLAYRYRLDQAAPFHGITFDLAEKDILKFSWLGQGPHRVWRNRLRGTHFDRFELPFKALKPSHDFDYPHARGYFAGIHEAAILTTGGSFEMRPGQDDTFLRIGTNDEGEKIRTYWPDGDLSLLHGIPAIGTKFHAPESLGPQSQFNPAPGIVAGKVTFRFNN